MFEDARGTVYDYHGGASDLRKAGCLPGLVGDPAAAHPRRLPAHPAALPLLGALRLHTPAPATLAAAAAERSRARADQPGAHHERAACKLLRRRRMRGRRLAAPWRSAGVLTALVLPEVGPASAACRRPAFCERWRAVRGRSAGHRGARRPGVLQAWLGSAAAAAALGSRLGLARRPTQKRLALFGPGSCGRRLAARPFRTSPPGSSSRSLMPTPAAGRVDAFPTVFAPVLATSGGVGGAACARSLSGPDPLRARRRTGAAAARRHRRGKRRYPASKSAWTGRSATYSSALKRAYRNGALGTARRGAGAVASGAIWRSRRQVRNRRLSHIGGARLPQAIRLEAG